MPNRSDRLDALLALALFALATAEVVSAGESGVAVLAAAAFSLPIALRRRLPIAAAAGVLAAPLLGRALGGMWESAPLTLFVAVLIVQYSVAAYGSAPTAVIGGLIAFAGVVLSDAWSAVDDAELGVMAALAVGPWLAGWFARPLRREAEELAVLAAELERQREATDTPGRHRGALTPGARAQRRRRALGQRDGDPGCRGRGGPRRLAGEGERLAAHGADAGARVGHRAPPHAADPAHRRGAAGVRGASTCPRAPARVELAMARRRAGARLLRARRVGGHDAVHLGPLAADSGGPDGRGHAPAGAAAPLPGRGAADHRRRRRAPSAPARPGRDAGERGDPGPDRALHGRRACRAGARGRERRRVRDARRRRQCRLLGRGARLVPVLLHAGRRLARALRLRGAAPSAQRASSSTRSPSACGARATRSRAWRSSTSGPGWRASCTTRSPTASASWCCRPAPPSRCWRRRPTRPARPPTPCRTSAARCSRSWGSCSASCTRTRTTARARRSRACRSSTSSSKASAGPDCRSSCASTASRPGWPRASTRRPTASSRRR